jgi:hypothetical protein
MTRLTSIAFALLFIPAFGFGCNQREAPEPQIASSAGESGYAARFPSELSAARGELQTDESNINMLTGKFPAYPAELDKPAWNHVLTVVDKADQAGRSQSYVDRAGETQVVQRFFDEEKDELNKKVGGAAQYAAIQKGCKEADVYGAVAHGLKEGVNKSLEKRLRERNEAEAYIQDNQEALGKTNVPKLEKQADDIAYASYLANIAVVQVKVRLKAMVAQGKDVSSTLDRTIADAQATAGDASRADADKKAAQKRLEAAQQAKQSIDSEVQQAEATLKDIDKRIQTIQEGYKKALDALRTDIQNKAKETPAPKETPKA